MGRVLRRWWPTLALLALGLASVALLESAHVQSRAILQQTIANLDNVSESRRRLARAYMIHERQQIGDPTFTQSSPLAELRAAHHALQNWVAGRSGIIDFEGSPPPGALDPQRHAYAAALDRLRNVLTDQGGDPVELRRQFSEADRAAAALEAAIHAAVRDSVRAGERAHRTRLAGWGFLLVLSVVGATYARRALRTAEGERERTESRLSRLREIAPVGIAECDRNGRVVAANRAWCAFTGESEAEWLTRPWWDALDESDRERGRDLWKASVAAGGTTTEARLRGGQTGASPTWVLIRAGGAGATGEANGRRVVTLTDITHQRQVEEQLHHAQRLEAVGRLAGGVAHDFNNLLTSIGGFAALAREEAPENGPLAEDLVQIERAADRGRALTRQLLTFSRQDRVEPQIVDARDVVRELNRMLDRLIGDNVQIEIDLGVSPATVLVDPNQLEQVITNLVVNAADAMEARGRIRISADTTSVQETFAGAKTEIPPGKYVLLSVSDTGPGVPPDVRERIFDPFFTTKPRGKGTGLGLSTVWGIVRQGGGHIHVYSEPGQGTVFKIYLPAAEAAGLYSPAPSPAGPAAKPTRTGTVLVVEDEDAVRRLTCRVLEMRGWTVLEAPDGTEALRILEQYQGEVDLIVTDLMMRGMGGVELVSRLRDRGVDIATLFVSGYSDSEVDLAGQHFLEKPFTPDALVRKVEAAVRDRRPPAPSQ